MLCLAGISGASAQDIVPYVPAPQPVVHLLPFIKPAEISVEAEEDPYVLFGDNLIATAKNYLGARYSRGGTGPKRFDCSGFTTFVYKKNNISLLRSSRDQFTQGTVVPRNELQKGDLVFFSGSRRRKTVGHVGIVTDVDGSDFSFIHAAETGVIISRSSEYYYSARYMGARRIDINS